MVTLVAFGVLGLGYCAAAAGIVWVTGPIKRPRR